MIDVRHNHAAGTVTVTVPFHHDWDRIARGLGGTREGVTWTFPAAAETKVRGALIRLFGGDPRHVEVVGDVVTLFAPRGPAAAPVRHLHAVDADEHAPAADAAWAPPEVDRLTLPDGILTIAPTVNDAGVPGVRLALTPHVSGRPPADFVVTARSFAALMDGLTAAYAAAVELPPPPPAATAPKPP